MDMGSLIPLPTAAKRLGVSETDLRDMIEKGTISLGVSPEGEIVVTQDFRQMDVNEALRHINKDDFVKLTRTPITVTEAADKYGLTRQLVFEWKKKGYIHTIEESAGRGRASRMLLDEADVAYCAKIFATRQRAGVLSGVPLLDPTGRPYLLKHPALSRYRHEQKSNE